MTVIVQERIVERCHLVLRRASMLFPHVNFSNVGIRFDLRGHQAGQCRREWGEITLRFNREYAEHDCEFILNDTVPHEVAHIARFHYDDGTHGNDWKKTCVDLGGTAKATHPIPKIFCKGRTYEYITTTGYAVRVSEHMHTKIQGGAAYRYSKIEGDVHRACAYTIV